jgi:hypothetical protein
MVPLAGQVSALLIQTKISRFMGFSDSLMIFQLILDEPRINCPLIRKRPNPAAF